MRDVSEEMRSAAGDLRRQDPGQASARGSKALEQLRQLQRQIESATPDEKRRALGDAQLEARQLADAQRQLSPNSARPGRARPAKMRCGVLPANRSVSPSARVSFRNL